MTVEVDSLSYDRIREARETLTAAAREALSGDFGGAIGAEDAFGCFCEAKRNLTALVMVRHGEAEWERMLGEDE